MLFTSGLFLFLFLPVTVLGFFLIARFTPPAFAAGWAFAIDRRGPRAPTAAGTCTNVVRRNRFKGPLIDAWAEATPEDVGPGVVSRPPVR